MGFKKSIPNKYMVILDNRTQSAQISEIKKNKKRYNQINDHILNETKY